MSLKGIDNVNATKANATKGSVYTIHTTQIHTNKYIEHVPRKPTTNKQEEKRVCKCMYANVQMYKQ